MALKTWVSGSNYQKASVTIPALPISLSLWVKPHVNPAGEEILLELNGGVELIRLAIRPGPVASLLHYDGGGTNLTSSNISLDVWHNFVGVFASTTSRELFVDGSSVGTQSTTRATPAGSGSVFIGGSGGNNTIGGADAACRIAYFGMWGTTALSASDVTSLQTLYPSLVQSGNLLSDWKMDALPIDDVGSNNWDLTISGSDATVDNSDLPPIGSSGGGGVSDKLYGGNSRGILDGVMRGTAATDEFVQRRRSRIFVSRHYGER